MNFDQVIASRFAAVERRRKDMHLYQEEATDFLRENEFSALFVDMGLGKTISSLTLIAELLMDFLADKVLVIGPLRVVTDTWPTEIGKWQHTAFMNHTLIRPNEDDPRLSDARDRARQFGRAEGLSGKAIEAMANRAETAERWRIMEELTQSSASVHFINREHVEWLCYFWKERWPYRVVFIDESSSFKDHNSKRFKALMKTRVSAGLITRLHILSATPAAETYEHLYPQIALLDRGKRLGKNITAFRNEHFIYNKYSQRYVLRGKGDETAILNKIKDICLVMKAEDYLPRQAPTIIRHKVKLEASQLAMIKKLENTFVTTLPDGTEIEANTAAALASMLMQMASGCVYETLLVEDWDTDDLKKVKKVHQLHDHKIDALREIAEEAATEGEPLLVAYFYKSSLAKLQKAFPKAVVMDRAGKCVKAWNAGKIPMLLIHPQSAGHGLNLQYGGHLLVFYDLIHSLEHYDQTIGRLARQGQKHPVIVKVLIAEGTRDELAFANLSRKVDAQEAFFRLFKRLIAEYRRTKKLLESEAL